MKLGVTLDILNQKDTPAFYADTLANRPAAGFTGRVFISTDTLDLYRDTGTTWVLLSPSSTGTITGSGAAGQVSYFSGASSIAGSNDLFFDSVNGHLGIGTITPSTALTIFHDQNQIIQINQTTATNDTKIAFQNSGTPLWRIGNSYNAGANDWGIFDVVGSIQPLTIKKTTGQTFIGTQTTSSGLFVVNSSTADNQIVAIGATAPSIRVRNAGTAPTQQFGLGLATTTNNFIQGSASGDFCIFNGSTTASPMLFGINSAGVVNEAARISASRNFLIGTTTDSGYKLNVNGTGYINDRLVIDGTNTGQYIQFFNSGVDRAHIYWQESLNNLSIGTYVAGGSIQFEVGNNVDAMFLNSSGNLGLGVTPSAWNTGYRAMQITSWSAFASDFLYNGATEILTNAYIGTASASNYLYTNSAPSTRYKQVDGLHSWSIATSGTAGNAITFTQAMTLGATGNLLIGTTTDAGQKLQVNGDIAINNAGGIQLNLIHSGTALTTFRCDSAGGLLINSSAGSYIYTYIGGVQRFGIKPNTINIASIPTSAAGLVSGDVYSNLGVLTIVP
jgi:hypothetical protein